MHVNHIYVTYKCDILLKEIILTCSYRETGEISILAVTGQFC